VTPDEFDAIFDTPFAFVDGCVAGFIPMYIERCECPRCRRGRGEEPDEGLARRTAERAMVAAGWRRVEGR
jgi:hypothetical protein